MKKRHQLMTFRGMVKDGHPGAGGWVFGYIQAIYQDRYYLRAIHQDGGQTENYQDYLVIAESVDQITPFTDRSGQDLYQGDVIDFLTMPGQPGFSRGRVIMHNGQLMAEEKSGRKISISVLSGQFKIRGPYYQEPGLMDLPAIDFMEDHEMEYQILTHKLRSFKDEMIPLMKKYGITIDVVQNDPPVGNEYFFQFNGAVWSMDYVSDLLVSWTQPTKTNHLSVKDFSPGDLVTYKGTAHSEHSGNTVPFKEHGIVKMVGPEKVFVVFNFDDDPERYAEFTGEGCAPGDLMKGWPDSQESYHYILYDTALEQWGWDRYFKYGEVVKENISLKRNGSDKRWIRYSIYEDELKEINN